MGILWTIIIGLIVGALAKLIMPGKDPGGIIVTILLGIAGSFVGSLIGNALKIGESGLLHFGMSILGALLLLFLYRLITSKKGAST